MLLRVTGIVLLHGAGVVALVGQTLTLPNPFGVTGLPITCGERPAKAAAHRAAMSSCWNPAKRTLHAEPANFFVILPDLLGIGAIVE
jgi:hypothetical protein